MPIKLAIRENPFSTRPTAVRECSIGVRTVISSLILIVIGGYSASATGNGPAVLSSENAELRNALYESISALKEGEKTYARYEGATAEYWDTCIRLLLAEKRAAETGRECVVAGWMIESGIDSYFTTVEEVQNLRKQKEDSWSEVEEAERDISARTDVENLQFRLLRDILCGKTKVTLLSRLLVRMATTAGRLSACGVEPYKGYDHITYSTRVEITNQNIDLAILHSIEFHSKILGGDNNTALTPGALNRSYSGLMEDINKTMEDVGRRKTEYANIAQKRTNGYRWLIGILESACKEVGTQG